MFKRDDVVEILTKFQDPGDSGLTWVVLHDEEKGRVDISPININLTIKPIYTLKTEQIRHVDTNSFAKTKNDSVR